MPAARTATSTWSGPGLRTRHIAHLEDLDATVIVESDCLQHQPVTVLSLCGDAFCAGEMRRQELSGSVQCSGRFVKHRGIALEDVGHPRGDRRA